MNSSVSNFKWMFSQCLVWQAKVHLKKNSSLVSQHTEYIETEAETVKVLNKVWNWDMFSRLIWWIMENNEIKACGVMWGVVVVFNQQCNNLQNYSWITSNEGDARISKTSELRISKTAAVSDKHNQTRPKVWERTPKALKCQPLCCNIVPSIISGIVGRLGKMLEMRKCIQHKEADQVEVKCQCQCQWLAASLKSDPECTHQAIVMSGYSLTLNLLFLDELVCTTEQIYWNTINDKNLYRIRSWYLWIYAAHIVRQSTS